MRARTVSTSLLIAATLVVAPVTAALADGTTDTRPGVSRSELAKAKAQARQLERAANAHRSFVLGGRATAAPVVVVDADPATVSTLTLLVHGGRYKALRGQTVTVSVADDAKVTRDGVVTLADVLAGDHVVVKARGVDVRPVLDAAGAVTGFTVTATFTRVAASPTSASVPAIVPVVEPAPTT